MRNIKSIAFGVAAWSALGCGASRAIESNNAGTTLLYPWEIGIYAAALNIIETDSANIRGYFVDGKRLEIAVWDTAVASFNDIDYDLMDFAPTSCMPDKLDTMLENSPKLAPCRSYSVTGLKTLSSSSSPNFIVKFGCIDSSYGSGGYILKAFLNPLNDGHMVEGGNRNIYDMVAYTFCFDRNGQIRGFKRIDPSE